MKRAVAVMLFAFFVFISGCDHHASTLSTEPSTEEFVSAPPASVTAAAPAPLEDATEHQAATLVAPAVLVAKWSSLLGRHVQMSSRVVRTVGFTEALVIAGGREFIVTASPECFWVGTQLHTFIVLGSTTVDDHGPVLLPNLLLEDEMCGS